MTAGAKAAVHIESTVGSMGKRMLVLSLLSDFIQCKRS